MRLVARAATAPYVVPPSQKYDGNDGSWSTFKISVGTPGQDFRVLPSTKSGVTQLVEPGGCQAGTDPANCPQLRGAEIFNSAQNIGFQANASSSWSSIGQYDVRLDSELGYNAPALFGFDKVSLGSAADSNSLSLDRQVVAGTSELDYFLGYLPLGIADSSFASLTQSIDSLLVQLRNVTRIPSLSYAYTAGAKYKLKNVFGSLILGGFDSTRFRPNLNNFSFTFSTNPAKLLTVSVESIIASDSLQGPFSLTSEAHFSVVDSTVPHLWLPTAVCTQFQRAFGLTYDPKTDLYLVNDTIHRQLVSKNPTFTFKFANSPGSAVTDYTNIELQYGAFDLQASYPYYPNATNYFPIRRAANDTQFVLGRTLLQEAYLIVDYERLNFTIAQAVFPDPLPAAKVVTIVSVVDADTNSNDGSSGLGTGAIVGIAIGAALLFFLAIFAFFWHRRRRTKKEAFELAVNSELDNGSSNHLNSTTAMKSQGPSELNGTPLTELASPLGSHYSSDKKLPVSINDTPQELHAEPRIPVTPRWEEVHIPLQPPRTPYDDGQSSGSRSISQVPSDDGYSGNGPRSGVSPLTGQFQR